MNYQPGKQKTTHQDARRNLCIIRDLFSDQNCKTYAYVICPFCEQRSRVYYWSYAAVGKRCICGALFRGSKAYKKNHK